MSTITEIQDAILDLSDSDFATLREWFSELDWEQWDRQFEADAKSGALDFLIEEVQEAKANNTLIDL